MYILLIATSITLEACAPVTRFKVLTFFFDGVPIPESSVTEELESELALYIPTAEIRDTLSLPERVEITFHEPYRNKECLACHDDNVVGKLVEKEPALCFLCHDDFNTQYTTLHGPVDAGFCSSCHHPHESKQENLLLKPGNELCFTCHSISEGENLQAHADNRTSACISCHDPHGTNKSKVKAIPVGR